MDLSQTELNTLAAEVMQIACNTLVVNLRYMDRSISMLRPVVDTSVGSMASDGRNIYYSPIGILRAFKKQRELPARMYLHSVMHCVYQHFWINTLVNQDYWDLACDMAVEYSIMDLELDAAAVVGDEERMKIMRGLKGQVKYLTADLIYSHFLEQPPSEAYFNKLRGLFAMDAHMVWYHEKAEEVVEEFTSSDTYGPSNAGTDDLHDDHREIEKDMSNQTGMEAGEDKESADQDGKSGESQDDRSGGSYADAMDLKNPSGNDSENQGSLSSGEMQQLLDQWKEAARQMRMDLETFNKDKNKPAGGLMQNLMAVTRERYDYREFLKRFAVMNERMKINDDEFDYIFYTYGLSMYGKMPLIEPLEYKEVKQIREFVIAIDTSGSTSGQLVQTFLQKTFNILKSEETFATRFNIHIIQCDDVIQDKVKITSQADFDRYLENMKIIGRGNTDFRPVFEYVDELIAQKELTNLKGLLYFTDGLGIFPEKQPPYNTAFVYIDEGFENPNVPVWAIKLVLRPEDIEEI